jgi:hypothetical protein
VFEVGVNKKDRQSHFRTHLRTAPFRPPTSPFPQNVTVHTGLLAKPAKAPKNGMTLIPPQAPFLVPEIRFSSTTKYDQVRPDLASMTEHILSGVELINVTNSSSPLVLSPLCYREPSPEFPDASFVALAALSARIVLRLIALPVQALTFIKQGGLFTRASDKRFPIKRARNNNKLTLRRLS